MEEIPYIFLKELSDQSLTSKRDISMLAVYLGVENPVSTVDSITRNNPRDIRQAGRELVYRWNRSDEGTKRDKVQKLRIAYHHLSKSGLFDRGKLKLSILYYFLQLFFCETSESNDVCNLRIMIKSDKPNAIEFCKTLSLATV